MPLFGHRATDLAGSAASLGPESQGTAPTG